MKSLIYISLALATIIISCKSSNNSSILEKNTANKVSQLIDNKHFIIECTRMYPTNTRALQAVSNAGLIPPGSTTGQINISGSNNYFKVKEDSIFVSLPFFGEQQLGGLGYNRTNTGFQFKGIPKEFNTHKNLKKNTVTLNYSFDNGNEFCKAQIKIFSGGSADINITSSHRTSIRYRGNIIEL